jgi:hypothetical protein
VSVDPERGACGDPPLLGRYGRGAREADHVADGEDGVDGRPAGRVDGDPPAVVDLDPELLEAEAGRGALATCRVEDGARGRRLLEA